MNLGISMALLAQAAPQGQPGPGDFLRGPLIPMIIMMAAFFFIMHRSQSKKAKEHEQLLKSLRPGDRVITGSGIVGTVVTVKDRFVSLRSADSKLEVLKSAISEVTERSTSEA